MSDLIEFDVDMTVFNKVFEDYLNYSSRTYAEAVNQHMYYIARDAVNTTPKARADSIAMDLKKNSRDYPGVPIAAILVNTQLGKKGKKGLNGPAMRRAVQDFIRMRQSHRFFVSSGWITAVKFLEGLVEKKGGKSLKGVTEKVPDKGGAIPAMKGTTPMAVIWNDIFGKAKSNAKVYALKQEGASNAVNMETNSMLVYITNKQNEVINAFNRGR